MCEYHTLHTQGRRIQCVSTSIIFPILPYFFEEYSQQSLSNYLSTKYILAIKQYILALAFHGPISYKHLQQNNDK